MSDEKYIQLVKSDKQALPTYFEESRKQALNALGPIQAINIFVGSTNSGKSRLLRWIMNNKSSAVFVGKALIDQLAVVRTLCFALATDIKATKPQSMSIRYLNNQNWGRQYPYPKAVTDSNALEYIAESDLEKKAIIQFDSNFFNNIAKALDNILTSGNAMVTIDNVPATTFLKRSLASIRLAELVVNLSILESLVQADYPRQGPLANVFQSRFEAISSELSSLMDLLKEPIQCNVHTPPRIYIPVLRTAIPLKISETQYDDQIYSRSIRERYDLDQKIEIFSGLELYQTILISRANEANIRDRLTTFCQFLSHTFFGGQGGELVSLHESLKKGYRINYSVNGIERPLHHLGDGIQAVIILMYQLFMAEPNSWIFIEEPEINLHPGFQRIVIDAMLNHGALKDKKLTIFMTSHSNHLLDISIPEYGRVSIFSLEKFIEKGVENFVVRSVNNKRMHALTALGAANSSVFMSNCSIWVEGTTDRKYLRAYLKAYSRSAENKSIGPYLEDIHYSFFEYSGSNLEHYVFAANSPASLSGDEDRIRAQFIANRVFLLADRDNGKEEKHAKWIEQKSEHFTYRVTTGKEVENMISEEILKRLLRTGFIKDMDCSTVDNVSYAEYQTIGIGQYLVDKFGLSDSVKEKSGTLSSYYKNKLAGEVSKLIYETLDEGKSEGAAWELLSEDAKTLTREIYAFIQLHNLGATSE